MDERAARFAGYEQARLRVWGVPGRPLLELRRAAAGRVSGRFPFGDDPVHVLTAFNPGPDRPSAGENERRQRALVTDLPPHVRHHAAEAGAVDGSHAEASVLVRGLTDDEAIALGARWGQDAIFRWTAGEWTVLPCDGSAPTTAGWDLREVPDPAVGAPTDQPVPSGPDDW